MKPTVLFTMFFVTETLLAQQQMGYVHGTVADSHGAVVPGNRIEITSSKDRCEVTANAEGKFNCHLPAGEYVLKAGGVNIMPYHRAAIRIVPSGHKFVIVRPVWVAPSDQNVIPDPPLRYESQALGDGLEVLVQFRSERMEDDKHIFQGKYTMLTFDDIAIYADEILCSKPIRSCSASGAVTVQVGKEEFDGTAIGLDFSTGRLTLTRDPKVVREFSVR